MLLPEPPHQQCSEQLRYRYIRQSRISPESFLVCGHATGPGENHVFQATEDVCSHTDVMAMTVCIFSESGAFLYCSLSLCVAISFSTSFSFIRHYKYCEWPYRFRPPLVLAGIFFGHVTISIAMLLVRVFLLVVPTPR